MTRDPQGDYDLLDELMFEVEELPLSEIENIIKTNTGISLVNDNPCIWKLPDDSTITGDITDLNLINYLLRNHLKGNERRDFIYVLVRYIDMRLGNGEVDLTDVLGPVDITTVLMIDSTPLELIKSFLVARKIFKEQ
jgi:hypothetical protein